MSRNGEKRTGRRRDFFSPAEVAEITGWAPQTVRRYIDRRLLLATRVGVGRFRRVPREALIRFMGGQGIPVQRLLRFEAGRIRVLVVDDDEAIIDMVVELLERESGFEVQGASTGFGAGLLANRFRPDVIVLDYRLPDLDGEAVIRAIRADASLQHAWIIVVSGVVDSALARSLLRNGANRFLRKPFAMGRLLECVHEAVK